MMHRFPCLPGGPSARGTPSVRDTLRRHPFLLPLLALAVLSQTGCQSGFFGPCGPCANGPLRGLRERVFNRNGACCGGSTVISDGPVIEGAPAVVAPATPAIVNPGATLPAPTEVSPQLETIPSATPGPASSSRSGGGGGNGNGNSNGGTQGAQAPSGTSNYEAARPRYRIGRFRGGNFPRTYAQRTPAPISRSARGPAVAAEPLVTGARTVEPNRPAELSALDNLPPLDLPRDEGRSEVRTTAASTIDGESSPLAVPAPADAGASSLNDPEETGVAVAVSPTAPAEITAAPGLRRFAVVEPKLAGGSTPTSEGLDWLVEKGYKTLVDLREPDAIPPSFLADVTKRGLRYISLPISLTTVDNDHVSRFHFEIALSDARPIYFCDNDGNRAGLLWYLDRMTVKDDSYDPEEASRQAEEIGLVASEFREAAQRYLEALKSKSKPETVATAADPAPPSTTPAAPPPTPVEPAPVPGSTPLLPDESRLPAKPEALTIPEAASLNMARTRARPPARPVAGSVRDPDAWRPFLALLLAGMGVPVAYWSRSLISFRGLKRASLPGPRRRPRSLPAASGE